MKKLADAAGPLYKSLDDGQKHRFMVLARLGAERHGWRGHEQGRGHMRHHGPRGGQGPMGPDGDAPRPQ